MKRNILLLLALSCLAFSTVLSGCSGDGGKAAAPGLTITDTLGRQVEMDRPALKAVAIGPGAMRLCCYFNNPAIFAGIEQLEMDNPAGRPYLYAEPTLTTLPVIGPGGPNNAPDPERILTVKPDVIFSTYATDGAAADNLQKKTGIEVVVLSYGETAPFDPRVDDSLMLIGQVMDMENRALELIDLLQQFKTDLEVRTGDIPAEQKPLTYIGGLSMKGTHGIESTRGNYPLFKAVHARNAADETGRSGSLMIDKEQLIKWDPDIIFIDGAGYPSIMADYQKNQPFYQTLSAVAAGETYLTLPYSSYATNIDTAIADAYYIGKVLYPHRFNDIDPEQKTDEIYRLLLGKEVYKEMVADYGRFRQVTMP